MATYASVIDVLARLYGAGQSKGGSLKGRLQNLARMGIPLGPRVGTGTPIDYGTDELYQLSFALELEDACLPPSLVGEIIGNWWKADILARFEHEIGAPAKEHDRLFFICTGQVKHSTIGRPPFDCLAMFQSDTSPEHLTKALKDIAVKGFRHSTVINVSKLTRDIERLRAQAVHVAPYVADNRRVQIETDENKRESAAAHAA